MPHMPLGAHGVAISTIFNVDFFKQMQQTLAKKSVSRHRHFQIAQYPNTDIEGADTIKVFVSRHRHSNERAAFASVPLKAPAFVKSHAAGTNKNTNTNTNGNTVSR